MKKKVLALVLAVLMTVAVSGVGMAAPITQDSQEKTGSANLSYTVTPTYTVTIPADLIITAAEQDLSVYASNVLIGDNETLTVTMTSGNFDVTNKYHVKYGTNSLIKYTIKNGETELTENGQAILSVSAGTKTGSTTLKVSTDAEKIAEALKAGAHIDTLTFNVAVN